MKNVRSKSTATFSLILMASVSSGCLVDDLKEMHGATKNMDESTTEMNQTTNEMSETTAEMKDITAGMSETTSEMNETTQKMNETTSELAKTITATYADLRQGDPVMLRSARLERMEDVKDVQAKISEAAKFHMAFEFQLWKAFGADTKERREELYEDAVVELFRTIQDYTKKKRKIKPTSNNQNLRNLMALAVTMHRINPNQKLMIADHQKAFPEDEPIQEVSTYTLLKDGLRMKKMVDSGAVHVEDLPAYQRTVLKYEQDAVYMMQLRYNFLATMAVANIGNISKAGFFAKAGKLLFKWDAHFGDKNLVQIAEYRRWVDAAIKVRRFLKEIGVKPYVDKRMMKMYGKMSIKLPPTSKRTLRDHEVAKLKQTIDLLKSEFPYKKKKKKKAADSTAPSGGWSEGAPSIPM